MCRRARRWGRRRDKHRRGIPQQKARSKVEQAKEQKPEEIRRSGACAGLPTRYVRGISDGGHARAAQGLSPGWQLTRFASSVLFGASGERLQSACKLATCPFLSVFCLCRATLCGEYWLNCNCGSLARTGDACQHLGATTLRCPLACWRPPASSCFTPAMAFPCCEGASAATMPVRPIVAPSRPFHMGFLAVDALGDAPTLVPWDCPTRGDLGLPRPWSRARLLRPRWPSGRSNRVGRPLNVACRSAAVTSDISILRNL